jgi:hypothetical protein
MFAPMLRVGRFDRRVASRFIKTMTSLTSDELHSNLASVQKQVDEAADGRKVILNHTLSLMNS